MRKREKRHIRRPFPHVTLAAAIQKAMGKPSMKRYLRAAELADEWEAIVGSDIAEHVQPESFDRGILTLKTDSSVWRQQVILIKQQILDRIASEFCQYKVRDVCVK